jgi:hypothetical protein
LKQGLLQIHLFWGDYSFEPNKSMEKGVKARIAG